MRKGLAAFLSFLLLLFPLKVRAVENCENIETAFTTKVPFATVQARCAGGTNYLSKYGVTRKKVVAELTAHENDSYYLGTPYVDGDWQSPRGDISYNGSSGMNCAGFPGYVLRKCGLNTSKAMEDIRKGRYNSWGSPRKYALLSAASNYMSLIENGGLVAYAYESREALLAGGRCEKGDLILRFWTDRFTDGDPDNHLMIFWGSRPNENKVWHSASGRNHIGPMVPGEGASFILIKLESPAKNVADFRDVWDTDWYAEAVQYMKDTGLMSGVEEKVFEPQGITTRGQFVAVLWRIAGKPEPLSQEVEFSDVRPEQYYAKAISWAREKDIVAGYADGTFRPGKRLSRQDMAVLLYHYCAAMGLDTDASADLSRYRDATQIEPYARIAMKWANAEGLIEGTSAAMLSPSATALRCQTAAILMRFQKSLPQKIG